MLYKANSHAQRTERDHFIVRDDDDAMTMTTSTLLLLVVLLVRLPPPSRLGRRRVSAPRLRVIRLFRGWSLSPRARHRHC